MSKEKLITAKKLIQEKKYDDARQILTELDSPTAQKWLAQLDRIALKQNVRVQDQAANNHIAGISSAVVITSLSVMLLITFLIAIYGAFLRPTSTVKAQQTTSQSSVIRWEYLSVEYSQNKIYGTSSYSDDVSRYELVFVAEPYYSVFLGVLTEGCTITDSVVFDTDVQKCIGENFKGQIFFMDALGADGWELVLMDNTSNEYSYKIDIVFKRPLSDAN